jgi:hypothetical protein
MQQQHMQTDADGNRSKLFAGLTKKLVSLEQDVTEKDAQLRAYQSRDAALSLELHNTAVALGQERSLLNLANSTISKLEAKMQEILPQFEYQMDQQRQVASLEEQLSLSNASLDELRSKFERLVMFKEETITMDSTKSVSDREMLGSLIREVQSERSRAEQTRIRILEKATDNVCYKKQRALTLDSFKRWKDDVRFCHKYNAVYLKCARSHGTYLLRTVMQSWRLFWPVGKYLSSSCNVRRMNPLLHSECKHRQERRCLSLRLLRNIGIARMTLMIWKRVVEGNLAKDNMDNANGSSGYFINASTRPETTATKSNTVDSSQFGVLLLNLRVKFALKRLLLIWHYEASNERHHRKADEFENEAGQARTQLADEMQQMELQRKMLESEADRIRSRSHQLAQKTVETLFGTNIKLILQSSFNKLKNCALEGRSRKIEELQESVLRVGENTAVKLLQYETAITMAKDFCIRRLLPEIAFLTWKKATIISQATDHENSPNASLADAGQFHQAPRYAYEPMGKKQQSLANATDKDFRGYLNRNASSSTNVYFDMTPESFDHPAHTHQYSHRSQSTKNVGGNDIDFASSNQGQNQTLAQLASFLMPSAVDQSMSRSPLFGMHQALVQESDGEMRPHHSSLLDLQQKLSRLENRWASIRLNSS